MPQMVTHYRFGLDAAPGLEGAAGQTPETRAAYLLGNQGPDPFFFLVISPGKGAFAELGSLFHEARPGSFLCAAAAYVGGLEGRRAAIGRSYLAGLACHYLLDRSVHPLVYFWERAILDAGVGLGEADATQVHAEIERDIDEAVLYTRFGATVADMCPAELALASPDSVLEVAGELYAFAAAEVYGLLIDQELFGEAVRAFRRFSRIVWSPTGGKRALLSRLEGRLTGESSMIAGLAHLPRKAESSDFANAERRPWKDPFTGAVRTESLEDLANASFSQAEELVCALLADGGDPSRALALTAGLNFGGEYVGEDACEPPSGLASARLVDKP